MNTEQNQRPWTAGPWEAGEATKHQPKMGRMVYCNDALGSRVADCSTAGAGISIGQEQANTILIAAAPELAEALANLLAMSDAISEHVPGAGWRMAQYEARTLLARVGVAT